MTRLLAPKPTDAAQEVFACACREAATHSLAVGPEHVVLAAALEGRIASRALADFGVSAEEIRDRIVERDREALAALGISLESVRGEIVERFGRDAWERPYGLPIAPEVKRALELAVREAAGLRRRRLAPEEVLLAFVRHSETARGLLRELDVDPGQLAERLRLELRVARR